MLRLEGNVRLTGLRPEMLVGLTAVASCFAELELDCIVTSALDGRHMNKSLHYAGQALDFRTRHVAPDDLPKLTNDVVRALGSAEFDVVGERDHLHVEFQPEGPR